MGDCASTERSDQEWVRALRQEDPEALDDLWRCLFEFAWITVRWYRADEDVAHASAVNAFERVIGTGLNLYKFNCPFLSYCRVFVVNETRRELKKQNKIRGAEINVGDDIIGTLPDDNPPAEPVNRRDIHPALVSCLDTLDERNRRIIELIYFGELTPEEVADIEGLSRNYINVIAYRARRALLDCLKGNGYETVGDFKGP